MVYRKENDPFWISTDKTELNIEYIHAFLSQSYWARAIPLDTVKASIEGSLCFGLYDKSQQIGFGRVITDSATFAYLADIFVDQAYRGHGLGKWLTASILAHPQLQGLRRLMLATKDAHGLYKQFGFSLPEDPSRLMVISRPFIGR